MNWSNTGIINTVLTVLSVIAIVVFLFFWLGRIRDKQSLGTRLIATGILVVFFFISVVPAFRSGGYAQLFGLFFALIFGGLMAVVWAPVIAGFFGDIVGSMFDGGTDEADPKPFYSIFQAKRAKGQYLEALAEVRRQLDRFPTDFEGQMFLAELQAENLNDLPGAEVTVQRLCSQPGHAPVNISYAFNHLADWHLSITKDRESAQRSLEQIIALLPDTEWSLQASQRIGRLADAESLLGTVQRGAISVKKGEERVGLMRDQGRLKLKEVDQAEVAANYVKHLEAHPLDGEIREKLAMIYARHFHRLDLALDQLEQMVQQPNQPSKLVVHWLNLMADLQVQEGASLENIRDTLQRIVTLYPDLPAGDNARRRLDTVRLELKGKERVAGVRMGEYEQNIGLKRRA